MSGSRAYHGQLSQKYLSSKNKNGSGADKVKNQHGLISIACFF